MMSSEKYSARSSAVVGVAVPELTSEEGAEALELSLDSSPTIVVAKSIE